MTKTGFRVIQEAVQPDPQGYICLGNQLKLTTYRVLINDLGQILLEPIAPIPESEVWLHTSPEALALVKQGITESAEQKGSYLGSFAEYASLMIEEQ